MWNFFVGRVNISKSKYIPRYKQARLFQKVIFAKFNENSWLKS